MTRSHRLHAAAASIAIALVLAACGGSDGEAVRSETSAATAPSTSADGSPGVTTGTIEPPEGTTEATSGVDSTAVEPIDTTVATGSDGSTASTRPGETSTTSAGTGGATTTQPRSTTTTVKPPTTATTKPPTTTTKPVVTAPPTTAKPAAQTRTFSATYGSGQPPTFTASKGDYVVLTINSVEDQEFHIHNPYDIVNGGTHVTFEFTADQVGTKIIVESHTHPGVVVCYLTVT